VTKQRLRMTHDEAVAVLESLATFPVWPISRELVLEAIEAKQRFGVSYWDAAILTAARQMGCQTLYSEDLNPGQVYDGVTVINPPHDPDALAHSFPGSAWERTASEALRRVRTMP